MRTRRIVEFPGFPGESKVTSLFAVSSMKIDTKVKEDNRVRGG